MTDAELRSKAIEVAERLIDRSCKSSLVVVRDAKEAAHELARVADCVETYLRSGLIGLIDQMNPEKR